MPVMTATRVADPLHSPTTATRVAVMLRLQNVDFWLKPMEWDDAPDDSETCLVCASARKKHVMYH